MRALATLALLWPWAAAQTQTQPQTQTQTQQQQQQEEALLAFCEANAGALMCQSSGDCTDDRVQSPGDQRGTCWREGSDPCADTWKGVVCEDNIVVFV
eukprot:COSAG02_NODE_37625_length_439_cov_1.067647_1_plen_98_part_00